MLKKMLLTIGCSLSLVAEAGTMGMPPPPMQMVEVRPWYVMASLGYTSYEYGTAGQGQTPVGRFAIGKSFCDFGPSTIGLELGVQNGNTMNLFVPQETLNLIGGVPITARVTPLLDLLADFKWSISPSVPAFVDVKLGIAYRRMSVINRGTINNKSQIAGEVQAGVGMPITEIATLSLLYQGVYGSDLGFSITDLTAGTAYIKNIPVQNGILLTLNMLLNA